MKKYNTLIKEKEDHSNECKQQFEDQERMKREKIKNEVVNLTKDGIDSDVKKYLALGPDLEKASDRQCETNLTKEELQGKKKVLQDKNKVFLLADKGCIMVAMDKYASEGGGEDESKTVRANKDWDLTDKVCRDGVKIIDSII